MGNNALKPAKKGITLGRGVGQVITVSFGLLALMIVFSFVNNKFLSGDNLSNLIRQIAPFVLIGIGQSYVLITGNIDLSIGSVVGMSTMISATLMSRNKDWHPIMNPWGIALIAIAASLLIGLINGILVAKCKLPPFIGTLGTMTVARGIAQLVNNNRNTDAIGPQADGLKSLFYYGKLFTIGKFTIYTMILIAIVVFIVFNFILSRTRTGRHIYAIGSNIEASRLSGVNVVNTTIKAYLVASFCSGLVGLMTTATTGMGSMDAGNTYELYAVAASVIGGVSPLGGQGILIGTVVGASIWGVLQNGLQFAGAPVALRNIIIGIIVVASVLLDVVIRSRGGRAKKLAVLNEKVETKTKA